MVGIRRVELVKSTSSENMMFKIENMEGFQLLVKGLGIARFSLGDMGRLKVEDGTVDES